MFACLILKLHVYAAGKAAAHLRRIREEAAVGVNGLVEQVVGFDVPIPLAIARIAAVVCAEVEHMVSGRAHYRRRGSRSSSPDCRNRHLLRSTGADKAANSVC